MTHIVVAAIAIMTWYGGDLFLGEHHAAHWHGKTPACAPSVVDEVYPGVAACVDEYEFGTVLRFTRLDTGHVAYGVVIDRMRDFHNCGHFDAQPRLAQLLGFGPTHGSNDVGVIKVKVEVVHEHKPH